MVFKRNLHVGIHQIQKKTKSKKQHKYKDKHDPFAFVLFVGMFYLFIYFLNQLIKMKLLFN